MTTKIEPIKSLGDLKDEIPEILILVHKDDNISFTIIGKPEYDLLNGLKLSPYLDFSFVIDMIETRSFEELNILYKIEIGETRRGEHSKIPFEYNPNRFPNNSKLSLYKMLEE